MRVFGRLTLLFVMTLSGPANAAGALAIDTNHGSHFGYPMATHDRATLIEGRFRSAELTAATLSCNSGTPAPPMQRIKREAARLLVGGSNRANSRPKIARSPNVL